MKGSIVTVKVQFYLTKKAFNIIITECFTGFAIQKFYTR